MSAVSQFADSSRMTPEALERRRRIVDAMSSNAMKPRKIEHWMQGVAQMAEAGLAGYQSRQLDQAERRNAAESAEAIKSAYSSASPSAASGGVMPPPVGDPTKTPPMGALPGMSAPPASPANTVGKIYENDEPSPLDPPSGADRDRAVRTIIAEAGNQGATGQNAVASVIRNRAVNGGYGGDTASGVVTAKNQFEPWNTAEGRSKMAAIDPNSPAYQQADAALSSAYAGNDPTDGAKNFISPKVMAALGRPMPAWAQGPAQMIGDHKFIGGKNASVAEALTATSQQPYQVAGPAVASPAGQAPTGTTSAIVSALGNSPVGGQPQPDIQKLITNATNPYLTKEAREVSMTVLQSQLAAQKIQTVDLGNAIGIMDQRGNLIRSIPKVEPNKGPQFTETGEFDQVTGQPVKGWVDARDRSVVPYRPQGASSSEPSVIPPVPPGVDPKVWRQKHSEQATASALPPKSDDIASLRKEIRQLPSYKSVAEVGPRVASMVEAAKRDNRASDLTLVYGLMKTLDPTSVVRESEAEMAKQIATLPEQYRAQVESFLTGKGRLAPEVRAALLQEARGAAKSYYDQFNRDTEQYRGIAKRNRFNEEDVIPAMVPLADLPDLKPAATTTTPTNSGWIDMGGGARIREKR